MIRKYDDGFSRCQWPGNDELYLEYHDTEWGVPLSGDQEIFERICLEGFQAGLSWITILKRREGFRMAFKNFDYKKVAKFTQSDVDRLMLDERIIRNRSKIESAIKNARLVLEMQKSGESISDVLWQFAPPASKKMQPAKSFEWVAVTPESTAISKELRARGFGFVGPTTMYALMQSIGMVNDHAPGCFRRKELA
ncbi:DNA-3-methyladenine glycosylase I [Rhodoluna lacicola]|jgi:DNA-3-methyladenine glycosylase I|uniref:DNA-3-methyladenine glycosylase I n=1 Tax=Rhodoluna lacicola TaxID=529884 RepID=UPI002232A579|nr:DNA-3-methyladenine glycosylase I [Rhodoluna lacicola]BDS50146.1 DNA-3-methyladenine glycosylase I [Rhodoluna lacicola]